MHYIKITIQFEQTLLVYKTGFCHTVPKPQLSVTFEHSTKPVKMFEHNGHLRNVISSAVDHWSVLVRLNVV
jgi:hypothetical protein